MEFFTMLVAYWTAALMVQVLSFPLAMAVNHHNHIHVPALFIFGDSLADAGNNNFIANTTSKANFPPYGETFFHRPTGRFSNGRTAFDFTNIIPLSLQIRQFANYSSSLEQKRGNYYAKEYLSHFLYTISVGGNDIGLNYLANTTFQRNTSAQDFIKLLLSIYNEHLLSLYNMGARKFLVIDSPVVGCTPNSRIAGVKAYNGGCLETANQLAVAYNDGLRQLINQLNRKLDGATILLTHVYDFVLNLIQHGKSYGFMNTTSACCGAGPFNTAVSCGLEIPKDKRGEYTAFLCKSPEKYVFWDGTHPTEKVYRMVSRQIWHGNTSFISPFNLKTLLEKH